jgi:hypothetical protein
MGTVPQGDHDDGPRTRAPTRSRGAPQRPANPSLRHLTVRDLPRCCLHPAAPPAATQHLRPGCRAAAQKLRVRAGEVTGTIIAERWQSSQRQSTAARARRQDPRSGASRWTIVRHDCPHLGEPRSRSLATERASETSATRHSAGLDCWRPATGDADISRRLRVSLRQGNRKPGPDGSASAVGEGKWT